MVTYKYIQINTAFEIFLSLLTVTLQNEEYILVRLYLFMNIEIAEEYPAVKFQKVTESNAYWLYFM